LLCGSSSNLSIAAAAFTADLNGVSDANTTCSHPKKEMPHCVGYTAPCINYRLQQAEQSYLYVPRPVLYVHSRNGLPLNRAALSFKDLESVLFAVEPEPDIEPSPP
jgi:hypothetical protein